MPWTVLRNSDIWKSDGKGASKGEPEKPSEAGSKLGEWDILEVER